jgi:AraC-like DNA-binding protein/quercetin dioxygenase-like cupin family protein
MYRWKESETLLNRHAFDLKGSEVSFKVHYWGANQSLQSNPYHKHSFFEVCFVLGGEGEYLDQDAKYSLRKGTWFCSRPQIYHQIVTVSGLTMLFIAFEVDETASKEAYVTEFCSLAQQPLVMVHEADDIPAALLWKSLLLQLDNNYALPQQALPLMAHSLILSFLPLFGGASPQSVQSTHTSNILLNQAKLYVYDNMSEPITLSKVAAYMNISERHLSRIFSAGIHESFTAYLRQVRIREAASLLKHSNRTIKEIAEVVGFGTVHYFTRTFHALMKITPARFREQSRLGSVK